MRHLGLAWTLAVLICGCSSQQNGGSASNEGWTGGASDLSGLGVEFAAPMDLESRSGTATSMVWVSAKNDEGLTVHYDASLTSDSLGAALPDRVAARRHVLDQVLHILQPAGQAQHTVADA